MLSLKLQIFSDIHNDWKTLERLLTVDADYYICAGDLVNWGRGLDRAGEILKARAGKVYVIPGNHETAAQITAFCNQFGLHDFHEKQMRTGHWMVAGIGYSSPTPFNTPGEYTETELAERLAILDGVSPLALICHAPPRGTALDRIREGVHAGSTAVRQFIEQQQPAYFFCGHIHEAEGAEIEIGATRGRNVGKRGYLLELD
jgi:Icc-related predicted phosphoesterase